MAYRSVLYSGPGADAEFGVLEFAVVCSAGCEVAVMNARITLKVTS